MKSIGGLLSQYKQAENLSLRELSERLNGIVSLSSLKRLLDNKYQFCFNDKQAVGSKDTKIDNEIIEIVSRLTGVCSSELKNHYIQYSKPYPPIIPDTLGSNIRNARLKKAEIDDAFRTYRSFEKIAKISNSVWCSIEHDRYPIYIGVPGKENKRVVNILTKKLDIPYETLLKWAEDDRKKICLKPEDYSISTGKNNKGRKKPSSDAIQELIITIGTFDANQIEITLNFVKMIAEYMIIKED